jgi:phage tail sheath protein FI
MAQIISPGVYTKENDLSQYVSNLSSTIVAMVGTAEFGPSETPILITSAQQFVDIFGNQNPKHYLGYAVMSYLEQGNTVYVSRVAPSDAKYANMTMVLPTTATPFAGQWTLVSNTQTSATFTVSDSVGLTGATKTIELDLNTVIPGFDFTDPTGIAPANGKLGSDLSSFLNNPAAISSYITGSTFTINSGAGVNSGCIITGLGVDSNSKPQITVNSTKFNSFNSPTTATAVAQLGLVSSTPSAPTDTPATLPTIGSSLAIIGATGYNAANQGTISLVYDTVGTTYATQAEQDALSTLLNGQSSPAVLAALNSLISISTVPITVGSGAGEIQSNVAISVPLSSTSIISSLTLINGILNSLINVLTTGTSSTLQSYTSLASAYLVIRAQSTSGIIGIGSIDSNGNSAGLKSSSLVLNAANNPVALSLYAITQGASGNWTYTVNDAIVNVINNLVITGTFTTNVYRPTWQMSEAGTTVVPTYLKFTSIGEGDFSDIAVTLTFVSGDLDSNQNQNYTVRIYQRQSSSSISATSTNYSDFSLIETYYGIPSKLMSNINSASQTLNLKIDYSTTDTASLISGTVVAGLPSDFLAIDPVLNTDPTGKGFIQGLDYALQSSNYAQQFGMFLLGGTAGSVVTSYDILGSSADKSGIYAFMDSEAIDINLLVAPGWSADPIVANGLISICESRGDCMTILDTPFALDVQSVVNYRNKLLTSASNYAAVYYPWIQIADSVSQKNIFVPPSGMVAGQYAYNDSVGHIFTAPAGRNRGNLVNALATERVLNQGDRDALTLAQINPIYTEAGYGIYIRGQMTLQTTTTALDRVNVRRLLLYLRKVIATASKYYEFEPADSITALRLKGIATSILQSYVSSGGIVSFTVDVGSDVNTALTLDNNELYMSISIVPTKTAEVIVEIFNLLGQSQGISIASS